MKKSKLKIIVMVAILVLLLIALWALKRLNARNAQKELEAEQKTVIASIATDDIVSFSYIRVDDTLSFTKENGVWVYDNDKTLELDQSVITTMLGNLDTVEADETLEDIEDLSEYGFDDPINVIVVSTASKTYTFTIGQYNSVLYQYYVKTDDSDSVIYLMSGGITSAFGKNLEDIEVVEETEEEETE